MKMCAQRKEGRGQRARCTLPMVPCGSHQSLAFVARHYHLLFIVILPCTIYTLLFLLFLLLSSGYPDGEPLLEDYDLKGDKV